MIRNRWRKGRYLVRSDESGLVRYDDETVRLWDGRIVLIDEFEERNPQEFVKAGRDPYPLQNVRAVPKLTSPNSVILPTIGETGVQAILDGPASHLFLGIGDMQIGSTFIVR